MSNNRMILRVKHSICRKIFTLAVICLSASYSSAISRIPSDIDWKKIETEHFDIIYDSQYPELGQAFAQRAEDAYRAIYPLFRVAPSKTVIWLYDHVDLPNGLATFFPRPMITVYPVVPSQQETIGHFGDWGQMLLVHELTHIMNFEPTQGFWVPLRFIMGSVVRPNALLPNWYLEGLAVEIESRYTGHGRLNSPYYGALSRAFIHDGRWYEEPLPITGDVFLPTWPYGQRPYYWGAYLMHEMGRDKTPDIYRTMNNQFSARFPYFLHGPAKDQLGQNWNLYFEKTRKRLEKIYLSQLHRLEKFQKDIGQETALNYLSSLPWALRTQISPDGLSMIFLKINNDRDTEVRLLRRAKKTDSFDFQQSQLLFKTLKTNQITWTPDSQSFVYDDIDQFDQYYLVYDLYLYHIANQNKERLTTRLRGKNPVFDQQGRNILFVQYENATQKLALRTPSGAIATLYTAPLFHRISSPQFISENEILFTERDTQGNEVLVIYQMRSGEKRIALADQSPIQNARWTSKGLLFTSSKSGVQHLYMSQRNSKGAFQRPQLLVATQTEITQANLDSTRNKIYYSELTGSGYILKKIGFQPKNDSTPTIDSAVKYPHQDVTPSHHQKYAEEDYSAWTYLFPQYWLPWFSATPDGQYYSFTTSGNDPLELHNYALAGQFDTLTDKVGGYFDYTSPIVNGSLEVALYSNHEYSKTYNSVASDSFVYSAYSFPFSTYNSRWSALLGGSKHWTDAFDDHRYEYAGPLAGATFDSRQSRPTQISVFEGIQASLSHQHYFREWGNTEFSVTRHNFSGYYTKGLPQRHVLAFNTRGEWSQQGRNLNLGVSGGGDNPFNPNAMTAKGYSSGTFLGWSMATATAEYRFPISDQWKEFDAVPFMIRRWHMAAVAETLTTDGYYYNIDSRSRSRTSLGQFYTSVGAELRADITLSYRLPAMMRLGIYRGLVDKASGGTGIFLSFSAPSF